MKKNTTNSFTIAHYILLFLVFCLCTGIIVWIIITRNNPTPTNNVSVSPVIHIDKPTPCIQRTKNTVSQMWAYDPDMVPQKYWDIALDYLNQKITTRTYGICQDVAYICHPGEIRRDCDPCAVPSARNYAMEIHIADMIHANCEHSETK